MSQCRTLVDTLKRQLKARGLTYAAVAKALELSEASVKRLFSEQNFTLQRLESLCELMQMDFAELVQQMESEQRSRTQLTLEQEEEIAGDVVLLLVAVCAVSGYTFNEIVSQYKVEETVCIRKLAKLDRLKIIELLPNNRIKLLLSRNFAWRANGPIQKFFLQKVAGDFFGSGFDQQTESLIVVNGLLSPAKNQLLQEKMQRLAQEFNDHAREDCKLAMNEKFGTTLVLAVRQWRYSLFEKFVK